jgi:hypothetical protein
MRIVQYFRSDLRLANGAGKATANKRTKTEKHLLKALTFLLKLQNVGSLVIVTVVRGSLNFKSFFFFTPSDLEA